MKNDEVPESWRKIIDDVNIDEIEKPEMTEEALLEAVKKVKTQPFENLVITPWWNNDYFQGKITKYQWLEHLYSLGWKLYEEDVDVSTIEYCDRFMFGNDAVLVYKPKEEQQDEEE